MANQIYEITVKKEPKHSHRSFDRNSEYTKHSRKKITCKCTQRDFISFAMSERGERERVHKSREPAETDSRFSSGFRVHACTYVKQLSDIMFDFFSLLPSSLIPSIVCISLSFFSNFTREIIKIALNLSLSFSPHFVLPSFKIMFVDDSSPLEM